MGPPENIILLMKDSFNIVSFIETGTYKGDTAIWASKYFKNVMTIENSKIFYDEIVKNKNPDNIEFLFGDSNEILKQIVPKLGKSAIFWLDAHWCGGDSFGEKSQCPLIQELDTIIKTQIPHFIFIDDARLFMSPPPLPNQIDQWPTIDMIIQTIQSGQDHYYIVIFEDVIIAVPLYAKTILSKYLQSLNTKWWQEQGDLPRKKGLRLIKQGISLLKQDVVDTFLHHVWNKGKGE